MPTNGRCPARNWVMVLESLWTHAQVRRRYGRNRQGRPRSMTSQYLGPGNHGTHPQMTATGNDHPAGPRSVPGRPGIQVSNLRRDLDELRTELGALATAQQEHTTALQETADLRDKLDQILAILDKDDEANPSEWFWLTMTDQQRDERLAELSDWVETVLRPQYPDYLPARSGSAGPTTPKPDGAHLALPALDQRLPDQTVSTERRRRLARPLVSRRHPPPGPGHAPVQRNMPAPAWPRCALRNRPTTPGTAVILTPAETHESRAGSGHSRSTNMQIS